MQIPRRPLVSAVALALGFTPARVLAQQAWRERFRVLRVSVTTGENETDRVRRFEPVLAYLRIRLGLPVKLRNASDYAGVIEALRANQVEVARMGPAAYARGWDVSGGRIEPIAAELNPDGSVGYFSVIAVRAASPYRTLDELSGKSFAFADQNSASGFQVPSYYLRREGKVPERFFGRVQFSGSHENSIIALLNGTFDSVATWWTNDQRSNYARMVEKGMVPADAVRVIWRSPMIQNSPFVLRSDLPADMKREIAAAILAMPSAGAEAWRALTDGKIPGLVPVTHADYADMVELTRENLRARRTN